MTPLGLYIHIPFCVRKCQYCDFVSYANRAQDHSRYFQALRQEAEWYAHSGLFDAHQPVTLYIGGGTPSLVPAELCRFRDFLVGWHVLAKLTEFTIEVNPGTIEPGQLQQLRQIGCTRLSIGVQSFTDVELRVLGRIHTSAEARACIHAARSAGFENISLDLIFGIPGSSLDTWDRSLKIALDLRPEHISMYNLTIEAGTPFWKQQQQGQLVLPSEELQLEMYAHGIAALTAVGYEHYEISNFARPGYRCEHNQIYWRNAEYVGFGVNAHSYLDGQRYWNTPDLDMYLLQSLSPVALIPPDAPYPGTVIGAECLDVPGRIGETIMLNLRLREGIDLTAFQNRFGQRLETLYAPALEKFIHLGLLEVQNNHLRLTQAGLYLANEVFQEFVTYDFRPDSQRY